MHLIYMKRRDTMGNWYVCVLSVSHCLWSQLCFRPRPNNALLKRKSASYVFRIKTENSIESCFPYMCSMYLCVQTLHVPLQCMWFCLFSAIQIRTLKMHDSIVLPFEDCFHVNIKRRRRIFGFDHSVSDTNCSNISVWRRVLSSCKSLSTKYAVTKDVMIRDRPVSAIITKRPSGKQMDISRAEFGNCLILLFGITEVYKYFFKQEYIDFYF